ncbi:helix-turn-helix transcriptional regulator [Duganella radicis]|uniref:LuxR family transcriptional regulator n=1 Tax=Duganella radicis TaxID=551988 RepID=A0A6L6PL05_9BURK|nr:helix-turn-helix transcriptional regulator [Duganella radicis]MTV39770.1 LuxR family transcriptional regulator [Duganella radicis]
MEQDTPWIKGVGSVAALPAARYQSFSNGLLEMGEAMRRAGPQEFLRETLLILRRCIGFDSAWWGEMRAGAPGEAPRNVLHASIGLSPTFAEEWNRAIAAEDDFAHDSIRTLGTVLRASGECDDDSEATPEMVDFVKRHKLHTIMAITVTLPGSGLLFFVCLYRHCPRSAFDDVECMLFQEFIQHMLRNWQYRLADWQATSSAPALDGMAIADMQGRLHYVGAHIGAALARHGDWQGTLLPPALAAALAQLPCSVVVGGSKLVLERMGGLVAVVLAGEGQRARLSPRELSAALLYARGQSYKEIARAMGLTPATVRTYLRNAYASLGVSNKIALATALAHA